MHAIAREHVVGLEEELISVLAPSRVNSSRVRFDSVRGAALIRALTASMIPVALQLLLALGLLLDLV